MDGELPWEWRLCHFLLSTGRMWGRGWQGSQAITQAQFIFLPQLRLSLCSGQPLVPS